MKFRCERDSLVEILTTAGRAVGTRSTASVVLSGVHISISGNNCEVTGTDLDLTIRSQCEVIGLEDGNCVVPARLAADIVRSLEPGAVTVVGDHEKVEISAARSHFDLRAFSPSEFPAASAPEGTRMEVTASVLAEGLRQVVRAASTDDARPLLTGVLFTSKGGHLRLIATDSYRLALRDLVGSEQITLDHDILVPARALAELQRVGGAVDGATTVVTTGAHDVTFSAGATQITSRLLDGTYPDTLSLIPDHYPNQLHVGKESLLDALRRVKLLVRDNTTPVRLSMRSGGVDLTVVSQEVGEASETVDGDFSGEDLVIAFNPTYLIDGVDAVLGDEVIVETADPSKPATVRATERDDYQYLLMPVRVS